MHRMYLRNLLEKYAPESVPEKIIKNKILQFVVKNSYCFERSLSSGHITASAWLLSKDMESILLMHHAKLDIWCQLGGHCDGESNVLNVAIKEAQEESGINAIMPVYSKIFDLDIHYIPAIADIPEHYHYDIRFLLKVYSDESVIGNNESKDLAWFNNNEELLPTKAESILRMFRKSKELNVCV